MPTPMKAFTLLAGEYGVDPEDISAVEKFFTSEWPEITSSMSDHERQELMDLLLSFDGVAEDDLPERIAVKRKRTHRRSGGLCKRDFIERVAERAKISNEAAEGVVNIVFEAMKQSLVKGERIVLRGIGSFSVKSIGRPTPRKTGSGGTRGIRGLMTYEIKDSATDDH